MAETTEADFIQLPSGQRIPVVNGVDRTMNAHCIASISEGFCPWHGEPLRPALAPPVDTRDDNGEPWSTHEGCSLYWQVTTLNGEPAYSQHVAWHYEGRSNPRWES